MKVHAKTTLLALSVLAAGWGGSAAAREPFPLNIPAGPLTGSLKTLKARTGMKFWYDLTGRWDSVQSHDVQNAADREDALRQMLQCTGLTYRFRDPHPVRIFAADAETAAKSCGGGGIPQIVINAQRTQVTSLPAPVMRGIPYVSLEKAEIENSTTRSLTEALLAHPAISSGAGQGVIPGTPSLSFNGFPDTSTVVLVDGERLPSTFYRGVASAAAIEVIPLAAVEKIEILPVAASAIYGGNATGGVVNVVLSKRCDRSVVRIDLGNSFYSGSEQQRLYAETCSSFDGTQVRLRGSHSRQEELHVGDRNFAQRGRETILAYNPGAIFGSQSPLLGSQINIRRRSSVPFSSSDQYGITTLSSSEVAARDTAAVVANAGKYNTDLADSSQIFGGLGASLLGAEETSYASVTVSQDLTSSLSGQLDLVDSRSTLSTSFNAADSVDFYNIVVPSNASGNFLDEDVVVSVPVRGANGRSRKKFEQQTLNARLRYTSKSLWKSGIDSTVSQSKFQWEQPTALAATAAISAGTLNPFQLDEYDFSNWMERQFSSPLESHFSRIAIHSGGEVFNFSRALATLAAQIEYHQNRFRGGVEKLQGMRDGAEATLATFAPQRQSVTSALVRFEVGPRAEPRLEGHRQSVRLAIIGRADEYDTETFPTRCAAICDTSNPTRATYRSVNPTFAIEYEPLKALSVNASFGTGFRTPTADEASISTSRLFPYVTFEPYPGDADSPPPVLVIAGGNPSVGPEHTRSWTVGFRFSPQWLSELSVEGSYSRIQKKDEIVVPSEEVFGDFARFEAQQPGSVTRAAVADASGARPIAMIDITPRNNAEAEIETVEVTVRYRWQDLGQHAFDLAAHIRSHTLVRRRASPLADWDVSTALSGRAPTLLGAEVSAAYRIGAVTLGLSSHYRSKYRLPNSEAALSQGERYVHDRNYLDGYIGFEWGAEGAETALRLAVTNMLNRSPRTDVAENRRAYISFQDDPRMRSFLLSVTKHF
jgi:iron complex outermembrane recepter protein